VSNQIPKNILVQQQNNDDKDLVSLNARNARIFKEISIHLEFSSSNDENIAALTKLIKVNANSNDSILGGLNFQDIKDKLNQIKK
jgi:hypothetical protein